MRWFLIISALLGAALLWLWPGGGFEQIGRWAAGYQRDFQNEIALALRGVRAGRAEAFWLLMAVCFAYGFFHAVGPGHGKVLIGGYGLGRRIAMLRLSAISLMASLGQAVTAVVLVYGGLWLFQMSRDQMIGTAEDVMAPVSYGAIVLIGLWLLMRGARRFLRRPQSHSHSHDHSHDHDHDHAPDADGNCSQCGHKHGPTLAEAEQVRSLKEAFVLIAGIALRPCTGALFVLVITWQMGIAAAGIAGAFAMALGTAVVTIAVGLGAAGLRGGMLRGIIASPAAARVGPLVEVGAGILIVLGAGGLLLQAI